MIECFHQTLTLSSQSGITLGLVAQFLIKYVKYTHFQLVTDKNYQELFTALVRFQQKN